MRVALALSLAALAGTAVAVPESAKKEFARKQSVDAKSQMAAHAATDSLKTKAQHTKTKPNVSKKHVTPPPKDYSKAIPQTSKNPIPQQKNDKHHKQVADGRKLDTADCYTLYLYDTWGDGWEGGRWTWSTAAGTALYSGTLDSTCTQGVDCGTPQTGVLDLCTDPAESSCYNLYVDNDSAYPDEITWDLVAPEGTYTGGSDYYLDLCTPTPSPTPKPTPEPTDAVCPDTCFANSCEFWVAADGDTCQTLETDYSCDCSGCTACTPSVPDPTPYPTPEPTDAVCPDTCFETTCEYWVAADGDTCQTLETDYSCDCSGCTACTPAADDACAGCCDRRLRGSERQLMFGSSACSGCTCD